MGSTGRGGRIRRRVRNALLAAAVPTAAAVAVTLLVQSGQPVTTAGARLAGTPAGTVIPFIPPTPRPTPRGVSTASPDASPNAFPPGAAP